MSVTYKPGDEVKYWDRTSNHWRGTDGRLFPELDPKKTYFVRAS